MGREIDEGGSPAMQIPSQLDGVVREFPARRRRHGEVPLNGDDIGASPASCGRGGSSKPTPAVSAVISGEWWSDSGEVAMVTVCQLSQGTSVRNSYKNRLQEHAQRSAIPMPIYHTVNEGAPHAPEFRCTVFVEETMFVSPCTFRNRKEAEQDGARVALEGIALKIRHEGVPLINNDTTFCKGILHEYASKMKIGLPKYTTTGTKVVLPLFITSVDFDGRTYTGSEGRHKKEAEQLAARAVIDSILGCSDSGTVMSQIIKSKARLYAALQGSNSSANQVVKGKEVQGALMNDKFPAVAHSQTFFTVQSADTAALVSVPTEARNPKKEHICEIFGSAGSGSSQSVMEQNDPPAGSTGTLVVPNLDESHVTQRTQVKKEFPFEDPSLVSDKRKSVPPSSDQKRSRKDGTEYHCKKARTDEQLSAAQGECHTNGNGVK